MKNKLLTISTMATLLGIYSASVYQVSLDHIEESSILQSNIERPALSLDDRENDKRRILDVVQVREFVTVESNLPVPGVECEITVEESENNEEQINDDLSTCLQAIQSK